MQFGKSKAKIANKDTPKTTFRDVAGCEEAIEELEEIKEFLAEPRSSRLSVPRSRRVFCCTARLARARRCWLGRSPARRVPFLHLRFRFRRDVRRCRGLQSPRSVRAGQGERARNRLHR